MENLNRKLALEILQAINGKIAIDSSLAESLKNSEHLKIDTAVIYQEPGYTLAMMCQKSMESPNRKILDKTRVKGENSYSVRTDNYGSVTWDYWGDEIRTWFRENRYDFAY